MPETMRDMPMYMGLQDLIMMLIFAALIALPFWFIFTKAGYSKWLSLLMLVPIVNVIMLYFFAFSTWPIHRGAEKA